LRIKAAPRNTVSHVIDDNRERSRSLLSSGSIRRARQGEFQMSVKRLTLSPAAGVAPGIGLHLSGMEEVREQLREAVCDLPDEELARRAVPDTHSIGALVLHIGEAEWWWMQCVISGHELTDEDRRHPAWDVLVEPEAFARRGYSAQYCLDVIDAIRGETRRLLASFGDDDLDRIYGYARDGRNIEVSLRWVLHHLTDHEAQHKGQILMLKRLLGRAGTGIF
jgi:uncharacterized damage-inducible protein DinB